VQDEMNAFLAAIHDCGFGRPWFWMTTVPKAITTRRQIDRWTKAVPRIRKWIHIRR